MLLVNENKKIITIQDLVSGRRTQNRRSIVTPGLFKVTPPGQATKPLLILENLVYRFPSTPRPLPRTNTSLGETSYSTQQSI